VNRLTVIPGHNLNSLKAMPAESVHCCVTSPPYWGLRDYGLPPVSWPSGWTGQHGLEPTPEMFIAHEVAIFREVRRVLRKDGTLWLNLGDCYATGAGAVGDCPGGGKQGERWARRPEKNGRGEEQGGYRGDRNGIGPMTQPNRMPIEGLKPKDLVGIPWRVALALQADGWYLRSDIIWHKPNPMPESVTDRPTKAHEYIFLLTKAERYFYDAEAIREPVTGTAAPRMSQAALHEIAENRANGMAPAQSNPKRHGQNPKARLEQFNCASTGTIKIAASLPVSSRNKRSVWSVPTAPYKEAHFATFPPDLIKPCILAGTSAAGCCVDCGAPFERVVELGEPDEEHKRACGADANGEYNGKATKAYDAAGVQDPSEVKARILAGMCKRKTVGWKATCKCGNEAKAPCVVLDPFGGSFTTGAVAMELGRAAIVLELNPNYIEMGKRRCDITPGLALA
jgi:DNA modification methylase